MSSVSTTPQLKSADLPLWNRALEMADPRTSSVGAWPSTATGLTMGTGFGASGLVLLDMTMRVNPNVDVFFIDTSMLFPETYELKDRLEDRYRMQFRRVAGIGLATQTAQYGDLLWETAPDLCCGMRKVRPLAAALDGRGAWMAALRRDLAEGRPGLRYIRKRGWDDPDGDDAQILQARLDEVLRMLQQGMDALAGERKLRKIVKFAEGDLQVTFSDQLRTPNTAEAFEAIEANLLAVLMQRYADALISLDRVSQSPHEALTVNVTDGR